MSEENLAMIVNCLRLRKTMYDADSDAAHELKNTIDMLTAKYYDVKANKKDRPHAGT